MLQKDKLRLNILMVLAMITWGLSWTNAKILGTYLDPPLIMFWRFLLASLTFVFVLRITKTSFKINLSSVPIIALNSVFMISYNYFYFKGTQIGLAGAGGVLVTTLNPILTTFFSIIFLKDRIPKKDGVGLSLGLISGCIILRIWELDYASLYNSGNLYFILASLSWVAVTITTSKSQRELSFLPYSFWSFIFSTILCISLLKGENIFSIIYFDWIFWFNLLILSIFAMAFGTSIYFFASVNLGPKKASSYIFLVPITAIAFSIYFLSEPPELSTLFGGLLGMYAVYMINIK
tara:strand:- start:755 stop:1630 length:876 start_codon:yes stop_codon:yes gene_type:complete